MLSMRKKSKPLRSSVAATAPARNVAADAPNTREKAVEREGEEEGEGEQEEEEEQEIEGEEVVVVVVVAVAVAVEFRLRHRLKSVSRSPCRGRPPRQSGGGLSSEGRPPPARHWAPHGAATYRSPNRKRSCRRHRHSH